ncbi:hypothetical protein CYMTET_44236 [Cymbomonas tetramitiformis]|uniref:Uncharacterized protein n=1 Tax=Cymbomonas tetramitiformis TaxID=36881 RepID=A0AAE0EZT5_9CHLO|nr:hypothetical protein CYMTET_44236 [Cymbomonas tetramitiformis]
MASPSRVFSGRLDDRRGAPSSICSSPVSQGGDLSFNMPLSVDEWVNNLSPKKLSTTAPLPAPSAQLLCRRTGLSQTVSSSGNPTRETLYRRPDALDRLRARETRARQVFERHSGRAAKARNLDYVVSKTDSLAAESSLCVQKNRDFLTPSPISRPVYSLASPVPFGGLPTPPGVPALPSPRYAPLSDRPQQTRVYTSSPAVLPFTALKSPTLMKPVHFLEDPLRAAKRTVSFVEPPPLKAPPALVQRSAVRTTCSPIAPEAAQQSPGRPDPAPIRRVIESAEGKVIQGAEGKSSGMRRVRYPVRGGARLSGVRREQVIPGCGGAGVIRGSEGGKGKSGCGGGKVIRGAEGGKTFDAASNITLSPMECISTFLPAQRSPGLRATPAAAQAASRASMLVRGRCELVRCVGRNTERSTSSRDIVIKDTGLGVGFGHSSRGNLEADVTPQATPALTLSDPPESPCQPSTLNFEVRNAVLWALLRAALRIRHGAEAARSAP